MAALGSPLAGLVLPHGADTMHVGSWDRKGGNADMREVQPGQTITLFQHQGAGIVHRFWVRSAPRAEMTIHRQAILRMYWDNELTPTVEVPVGDFFGVGFVQQIDYTSLPLNEMSGGYNCYWPMPFHKSARCTLTNLFAVNGTGTEDYFSSGWYFDHGVSILDTKRGRVSAYRWHIEDAMPFHKVPLHAGDNRVTVRVIGKDPRSGGYFVGIDGWVLKPAG